MAAMLAPHDRFRFFIICIINNLFLSTRPSRAFRLWEILAQRLENLQNVSGLWQSGDVRSAVEALVASNDDAALLDFINTVHRRPAVFTLDTAALVLPRMGDFTSHAHNEYRLASLRLLLSLAKHFAPVLPEFRRGPKSGFFDLAAEERAKKAAKIIGEFRNLQASVAALKVCRDAEVSRLAGLLIFFFFFDHLFPAHLPFDSSSRVCCFCHGRNDDRLRRALNYFVKAPKPAFPLVPNPPIVEADDQSKCQD
jgi:hypothetical protein